MIEVTLFLTMKHPKQQVGRIWSATHMHLTHTPLEKQNTPLQHPLVALKVIQILNNSQMMKNVNSKTALPAVPVDLGVALKAA